MVTYLQIFMGDNIFEFIHFLQVDSPNIILLVALEPPVNQLMSYCLSLYWTAHIPCNCRIFNLGIAEAFQEFIAVVTG